MNYRVVPESVVTAWAGDRLLVFVRHPETTHVLSPAAGMSLSVLTARPGVLFGAQDVACAWPNGDPPSDDRELLQLLEGLSRAGIVESCPGQ